MDIPMLQPVFFDMPSMIHHVDLFFTVYLQSSLLDNIDRKIEALLKDWHTNADMLFSIHPVDGSFLVW